jgi:uncharacterized coiled-coil protein SlyX
MSQDRLTELELRFMTQARLVEELDGQLQVAQAQLARSDRRLERLEAALEGLIRELGLPPDEKPPHY